MTYVLQCLKGAVLSNTSTQPIMVILLVYKRMVSLCDICFLQEFGCVFSGVFSGVDCGNSKKVLAGPDGHPSLSMPAIHEEAHHSLHQSDTCAVRIKCRKALNSQSRKKN